MHILFFTDNFPPEVNAPASRTYEHCRVWVEAGHTVTIITCAPNFPNGKVFKGYKNSIIPNCENMDGIKVVRVWSYITANEGFFLRTLDYISYMVSSTIASFFVPRVNIVIGTSPQFFTAWAACFSAGIKRVPFIFELRDLWPESIIAVGAIKNRIILGLLEKMELFLYWRAEGIISVTQSFKENLVRRGVKGRKICVVTNGVDLKRFLPMSKKTELINRLNLKDKFIVGYIGTHGMAHALETLILAGKILNEKNEKDIEIILLGDGARKNELINKAKEEGVQNVHFYPTVTKAEVPNYWSILDAAIIHLKKSSSFRAVIPSKLFECMGMGIPVLHGVEGESANIVTEHKVGLIFEPEDADELANSIINLKKNNELAASFRDNALRASRKFDRSSKALEMLSFLDRF